MASTKPPIKIGDTLKLGVINFGNSGDPMMKHEGLIIFLKNTKSGGVKLNTLNEVKITKVFPNYAFAELTKK